MYPLTTSDPASELALKLEVITEAIRMAPGIQHPEVVAALIHASAIADLADAIRSAGGSIESGLESVANCLPE